MTAETKTANMPYNTRRKSLSLPSLGIHLPVSHASRAAARLSPPSTATNSEQPPSKKMKRSHTDSPSMSPPPRRVPLKYEHTPPPSPDPEGDDDEMEGKRREIDMDSINDEIVEGVITQLQKTGNRPHLVKELAAILSLSVRIVEQSANPSAIISSRLSTYLKRSWSAQAPCPIAKELETVHPRRTYFYLTTYPHQPIPSPMQISHRAIITPSLSSASRSDEADADRRRQLSPSPEVDLSSTEFEDDDLITPPTPTGSYSGRTIEPSRYKNTRASSPPLEKDEKEFTQTARGMQKRKMSSDADMSGIPSEMSIDGGETLFGGMGKSLGVLNSSVSFTSSPAMKPSKQRVSEHNNHGDLGVEIWRVDGLQQGEWDLRSPENIELEELDGMFDDF